MHPFTITNAITDALTRIERARGFLEAARLSEEWLRGMQARALVLEAHYTTHIEGTHLTLDQSEKLLAGEGLADVDPEDAQEPLLNYRGLGQFELVDIHPFLDGNGRTTGWLEYFCEGLARQLGEVQAKGEGLIRQDVVALRHGLTGWQRKAVELALEKGKFWDSGLRGGVARGDAADVAAGVAGIGEEGGAAGGRGHPELELCIGRRELMLVLRHFCDMVLRQAFCRNMSRLQQVEFKVWR
jgi:Fic/DOC family